MSTTRINSTCSRRIRRNHVSDNQRTAGARAAKKQGASARPTESKQQQQVARAAKYAPKEMSGESVPVETANAPEAASYQDLCDQVLATNDARRRKIDSIQAGVSNEARGYRQVAHLAETTVGTVAATNDAVEIAAEATRTVFTGNAEHVKKALNSAQRHGSEIVGTLSKDIAQQSLRLVAFNVKCARYRDLSFQYEQSVKRGDWESAGHIGEAKHRLGEEIEREASALNATSKNLSKRYDQLYGDAKHAVTNTVRFAVNGGIKGKAFTTAKEIAVELGKDTINHMAGKSIAETAKKIWSRF